MKRFFKPVEKDGPSKKPSLSSEKEDGENRDISGEDKREPLKFLTWNANSFLLRVKNNCPEFTKFVTSFDPDVIAIQEVRMPAGGSKGAPKNPGELKDDTSSAREEKQILMRALSSLPFANYRVWWSLADSKYAGTALLVKKCCQPKKVFFNLDKTASKHEPDGRVILAEFDNFRLLNTYVPNNGWKEEVNSFVRRRKWDKRILEFVLQSSDKPLVWCGDLNVSHEEIDVSHPEFFSAAKLNGYVPPNKEVDCGQPGFTLAERMRFGTILKEYRGKRMRIDYFIVSEQLKDRIVACEMHGQGIELEGFYGSDHCPVTLELSQGCFNSKHDEVSA
ncbi:DNA-(apurinic or apyrimidinic site) endonuclease isoform X3 [Juglans microcarpa x Juglans regia]|uniref:DNA-(apurinic or apyrimidinic site) endonuclease isoform X3 n=1 Tax=Juglans microcarpa x Juglans regia TaxID=2249226 RepID=UPI001B7F2275|nr:DNA-(apurinic or apyrimidinic site) endonuclease isoform X3 [Juglans microcarpa x Juglans regia]